MDKLNAELAALEAKLSDPDLYAKNPDVFTKTTMAIADKRTALTEAEEEWLRVEMIREEIEG